MGVSVRILYSGLEVPARWLILVEKAFLHFIKVEIDVKESSESIRVVMCPASSIIVCVLRMAGMSYIFIAASSLAVF